MANYQHVAIVLRGTGYLNHWVSENIGTKLELAGAELRGADLSGADLRGANLRGANLEGVNFRGADLEDALYYSGS